MTALAFLFAVFSPPCPFYVLDEVEAALTISTSTVPTLLRAIQTAPVHSRHPAQNPLPETSGERLAVECDGRRRVIEGSLSRRCRRRRRRRRGRGGPESPQVRVGPPRLWRPPTSRRHRERDADWGNIKETRMGTSDDHSGGAVVEFDWIMRKLATVARVVQRDRVVVAPVATPSSGLQQRDRHHPVKVSRS